MFGRKAGESHNDSRRFVLSRFPSTDPVENLSLEHSLFSRYTSDSGFELLSFYINEASVVIGKHQNPWKEVDSGVLAEGGVPVLRRFSGGGTVYHDPGNVNWSFIGPKDGFSQEANLMLIADLAAASAGLERGDLTIGDRGDIFWRDLKISGNALAFRGDRALHHGTLLVSSDLGALGSCLGGLGRRRGVRIEGSAVDSAPSLVTSLSQAAGRDIAAEEVIGCALEGGTVRRLEGPGSDRATSGPGSGDIGGIEEDLARQYASQDWHFRRTPDFRIILNEDCQIPVRRGVAEASALGVGGNGSLDLCDPEQWLELLAHIDALVAAR
jgi:lipoate-protein ligase A